MDILCTCCGEPWDVSYVMHEEPLAFDRRGCLIVACPCCSGHRPTDLSPAQRQHLEAVAQAARLFGRDVDGFAAFLEDLQFA